MTLLRDMIDELTAVNARPLWEITTTTTTRPRRKVLRSTLPLYRSQAMKAVR